MDRCLAWVEVVLAILATAFVPMTARAAAAPATTDSLRPSIFDRVEEFRLDNGMLFRLLPRHDLPMVAGRIRFRAGGVDCPAGKSGLAHMFEHMALQGTDRIGTRDWKAERAMMDSVNAAGRALAAETARRAFADTARIARLRAELERLTQREEELAVPMEWPQAYDGRTFFFNATTSADFTEYEATLASNNLECWMLMESERIQHPVFRMFYRERDVVLEERRQGVEDQPFAVAYELLLGTAFQAHPYRMPVLGWAGDLETLTYEDAVAFSRTHYSPGNAVAALVGDFDPAVARRMIRDYFGDILPGPVPPEIATVEPPPMGQRRAVVRKGTERGLWIAFPAPAPNDRRAAVAGLLASVLSRDNTSRLTRRLYLRDKMVRSVSASPNEGLQRYPGLFVITAVPLQGFTNEQVEAVIWEELARVVREPVSAGKLEEITASNRKRFMRGLQTNAALAQTLLDTAGDGGDSHDVHRQDPAAESVTADEVTELARDLFRPDRSTVVFLEPDTAAAPPEQAMTR